MSNKKSRKSRKKRRKQKMGKKNKKQAKQNSNRVASRIRDWNAVDAFENRPAGPMRDRRKRRNEDKGRQAWRYGEGMEE